MKRVPIFLQETGNNKVKREYYIVRGVVRFFNLCLIEPNIVVYVDP